MLKGKVALVTGATRGIGKAIAERFAAEGADILLNGRNEEKSEAVAQQLRDIYNIRVETVLFDVSDYDAVKQAYRKIFTLTKRLDILVNNAGILDDALMGMVTREQIERVFAINTFGVLYAAQYAARMMQKQQTGSIINISSIIGLNGNEGQVVYGGSKAAVIGITRSLAKELAPSQIRVNAIAPGFIDTDMTRKLSKEKYEERVASIKMGRIGTPDDVANVVLFLASDLSRYVTGQVIGVDGGMLI